MIAALPLRDGNCPSPYVCPFERKGKNNVGKIPLNVATFAD